MSFVYYIVSAALGLAWGRSQSRTYVDAVEKHLTQFVAVAIAIVLGLVSFLFTGPWLGLIALFLVSSAIGLAL